MLESIPTQKPGDNWNCGAYVLYYVFATASNYSQWRMKPYIKCAFHEFTHHDRTSFTMITGCETYATNLRHQICALVITLNKNHSTATDDIDNNSMIF